MIHAIAILGWLLAAVFLLAAIFFSVFLKFSQLEVDKLQAKCFNLHRRIHKYKSFIRKRNPNVIDLEKSKRMKDKND